MPSKKRKYNARFPAGRIKKIMQTDEEVGKVAQAVPIIILLSTPRTLELFVESLLTKAMKVTTTRNAKTLSPSHVKQCILAESKFDFLRDLVKNIPDVSAAEEKEMMSAESSPNSSRFSDTTVPPRRIVREDSNSSSSSDIRVQPMPPTDPQKRAHSVEIDVTRAPKIEIPTSTIVSTDIAIDLTKKHEEPVKTMNFYQETLPDDVQHRSVITVNPTYASPQPSTSYTALVSKEPLHRIEIPIHRNIERQNSITSIPSLPRTPVTPILNIDFSKNIANPEIKLLDTSGMGIVKAPKNDKKVQRQNSRTAKPEVKRELKPVETHPVDIDSLNSGNLQIDEDYDV